jgi:hypothetical protein
MQYLATLVASHRDGDDAGGMARATTAGLPQSLPGLEGCAVGAKVSAKAASLLVCAADELISANSWASCLCPLPPDQGKFSCAKERR